MTAVSNLVSNPWFVATLAAVPAAVVGVILTLRLTRKFAIIRLTVWNNSLVKNLKTAVPGLGVVFNGSEIPSASVARVVIWNDGNVVIKKESLEPEDPIKVELSPGLEMLDVSVLHDTDKLSGFRISSSKSSTGTQAFQVAFEHLKPKQGVALQVVHTGTTASDFHLAGSLVDFPSPEWVGMRRRWLSSLYGILIYVFALSIVFWLFLPFDTPAHQLAKLTFAALWGIPAVALYFSRSRLGRLVFRVPTELRPYGEGVTVRTRSN